MIRVAAVVPAAGRSLRMGRPKLTLPVGGRPLIARVVGALLDGGAAPVVVVAPPPDAPGAAELAAEALAAGADLVVLPAPTPDMRATVEAGLDRLGADPPSAFLLAPGDSPGVSAGAVGALVRASAGAPGRIVVPAFGGRRGHPVALPWAMAAAIRALPPGRGINAAIAAEAGMVVEVDLHDPGLLADLDTPEDYRRWGTRG